MRDTETIGEERRGEERECDILAYIFHSDSCWSQGSPSLGPQTRHLDWRVEELEHRPPTGFSFFATVGPCDDADEKEEEEDEDSSGLFSICLNSDCASSSASTAFGLAKSKNGFRTKHPTTQREHENRSLEPFFNVKLRGIQPTMPEQKGNNNNNNTNKIESS